MKRIISTLVTSTMLSFLLTNSVMAEDKLEGTINQVGFGKYSIIDSKGSELLLNISRRETQYEPKLWRPAKDDKVSATYYEKAGRNGAKLVAKNVTLVKAGPNTIIITSPATVTITETGRSGFKTTLTDYDEKALKFTRHRGTKIVPTGWLPAAGEKAVITFRLQQAKFGFNVAYMADEVKRVE